MAETPTLPADPVLLRGYCGPCDYLDYEAAEHGETDEPEWRPAIVNTLGMVWYEAEDCSWRPAYRDRPELRLNPTLAPLRDHIARVMAEGVRCPACKGSCMAPITVDPAYPCPDCHGSGYLLPPTPIEHLMDRPGSKLTAAQSAACVAWSYRSWRVGGAVLADLLYPWRDCGPDADTGRTWLRGRAIDHSNKGGGLWVADVVQSWRPFGWECSLSVDPAQPWTWLRGPETGPQGRACADRAALAHHFALVNEDGTVTTPNLPENA